MKEEPYLKTHNEGSILLSTTHFIFLLGPTCIGKGFLVKLLMRLLAILKTMGLKVGLISFGQIIRDLMDSDPDFKAKYGPAVARGELLDDATAIELFSKELSKNYSDGSPHIVIVDGFCRSTTQIEYSIQNGYLQEKDRVCIIEGSFDTCFERFAHRKGSDTGRTETESETFRRRYHLHKDSIGDLRALFKETDAQLVDIDGNRDIAEFVFPDIASHLMPVFHNITLKQNSSEISTRN